MDPLDYLIEDCWLHLFQFLSGEDKQALCETCRTFYSLLQPQKVQWGFEVILPHIIKMFSHYKCSELASWRHVCKSWRAGFDKYCETSECNIAQSFERKYSFSTISGLENFLTVFKEHNENPFIGRRVEIFPSYATENYFESKMKNSEQISEAGIEEVEEGEENATEIASNNEESNENVNEESKNNSDEAEDELRCAENERREFIERCFKVNEQFKNSLKNLELQTELVLQHGKEIGYLTFMNCFSIFEYHNCRELDACKFLQLVLCSTPNLQTLDVYLSPSAGFAAAVDGIWNKKPDALQAEMTRYFELNPWPKLPRLREIKIHLNELKIETFLLETYGQNLENLFAYEFLEVSANVWGTMKCLRKLYLRKVEFDDCEKLLQALQSPLEWLYIREVTEAENTPNQFFIDKFLLAVQHLPLKKVTVCPVSANVKESAPFTSSFPRHLTIETLKFEIRHPHFLSVNFLPFLPNLKSVLYGGIEIGCAFISQLLQK